jgi:hypothetical protein
MKYEMPRPQVLVLISAIGLTDNAVESKGCDKTTSAGLLFCVSG